MHRASELLPTAQRLRDRGAQRPQVVSGNEKTGQQIEMGRCNEERYLVSPGVEMERLALGRMTKKEKVAGLFTERALFLLDSHCV